MDDRYFGTDGKFQDRKGTMGTPQPSMSSSEEDVEAEMVKKAAAALQAAEPAVLAKEVTESLKTEVERRK